MRNFFNFLTRCGVIGKAEALGTNPTLIWTFSDSEIGNFGVSTVAEGDGIVFISLVDWMTSEVKSGNNSTVVVVRSFHSALKLEKSAISKVQKNIIYISKMAKKSFFAPEKSSKLPKMQFSNFFLVQKFIFLHIFEIAKNAFLYF